MEQYCELLKGDHDFSPFVHKQARNSRDNCKSVTRFACTRIKVTLPEDGVYDVRFEIEASGFGRSQVRNFVGFIVDLCRGAVPDHETVSDWLWKESAEEVAKRGVIHAAPASGLCLEKVEYARTDAAAAALEMHIV
jgi:tRNA U38,U39,U40 pseudouridine synthase TruA